VTRHAGNPAQALVLATVTILLWASLATLVQYLGHVPPFLLVGLTLGIGSIPSLPRIGSWFARPAILLFGTLAFFGYHFFLFIAFRIAPAIEVNLVNYTWPVLIVLLSGVILPGHRLRVSHVCGGFMAFTGATMAISGGRFSFSTDFLVGYLLALAAALTWSSYSVFTKKLAPFPTSMVGGFCFCSSILALLCHALTEPQVHLSRADWTGMLILGIGPMGIAFYSWDASLKKGDPRTIGALSYLTPLLSTFLLSVFGPRNTLSWTSVAALILIAGGAGISSIRLSRKPF